MSLLSSWPRSSGNFHSVLWDMQTMQDFTPLLLHKDPKSVPQPAWPAQSVCSWSQCTGCPFPLQSHSWPIPGAPAVLPRTYSAGRFDILNSYYRQTPFTELVFAGEWIILFDNTIFTSGKMWHSRHQIFLSVFCLAIEVPDYNPWEFNTPLQQFPVMLLEWAWNTVLNHRGLDFLNYIGIRWRFPHSTAVTQCTQSCPANGVTPCADTRFTGTMAQELWPQAQCTQQSCNYNT